MDTFAHAFSGHSTHLGVVGPGAEAWAWHLTFHSQHSILCIRPTGSVSNKEKLLLKS